MQHKTTWLKKVIRPFKMGYYSSKLPKSVAYFDFHKVIGKDENNQTLLDIFKLRFEVYCLERHFLDSSQFEKGLETDDFDDCSTHFAAYAKNSEIVGTVRLVQPDEYQVYPWESHCQPFPDFTFPKRETAAEISRLVVRKTYRRRCGDSVEGIPVQYADKSEALKCAPPPQEIKNQRVNSPLLLLGLYREMYRHSRKNGIRYWYAAMERSLARSLERMGFKFVPIGPQVDYYGPVTPHMVDLEELNARLHRENKLLAAWFNDEPISIWFAVKSLTSSALRQIFRKNK